MALFKHPAMGGKDSKNVFAEDAVWHGRQAAEDTGLGAVEMDYIRLLSHNDFINLNKGERIVYKVELSPQFRDRNWLNAFLFGIITHIPFIRRYAASYKQGIKFIPA